MDWTAKELWFDTGLGMSMRFFSSQKRPDQLWSPPSSVLHGFFSRLTWR